MHLKKLRNIKLQEGIDMLGKGGKDLSQRILDRLESWADRNPMDFKNVIVLHLRWNNPVHQYRLQVSWMERCFAEKDLDVPVDKLTMSKKCALAAKKGQLHPGMYYRKVAMRLREGTDFFSGY